MILYNEDILDMLDQAFIIRLIGFRPGANYFNYFGAYEAEDYRTGQMIMDNVSETFLEEYQLQQEL